MNKLKPCPCGKTPENVSVYPGNTCKWAYVTGDCCQEWHLEFRTYFKDGEELMRLAVEAWNEGPRG